MTTYTGELNECSVCGLRHYRSEDVHLFTFCLGALGSELRALREDLDELVHVGKRQGLIEAALAGLCSDKVLDAYEGEWHLMAADAIGMADAVIEQLEQMKKQK